MRSCPSGARSRPITTCRGRRAPCASTSTRWRAWTTRTARTASRPCRASILPRWTTGEIERPSSAGGNAVSAHRPKRWPMRPAWSVILLTTLTGAAQGLLLSMVALEWEARARFVAVVEPRFFVIGSTVAVGLAIGGLIASFFHLGRPERAWRSAAMWRTSWLSREVLVLPAFIAGTAGFGVLHAVGGEGTLGVGAATAVLAIALFVCTGMIYACLRFIQEWSSPLTVVNYILIGCASGALAAAALSAFVAP